MSNPTNKDPYRSPVTWKLHFFPSLLEMMEEIPPGDTFTSSNLREEFKDKKGMFPLPGFWGYAMPALLRLGLIRKTGRRSRSIIPASRGRRLPVWEKV